MRFQPRWIAIAALASLVACGGGGGGSSAPSPSSAPPPAVITVVDIAQPWVAATPAAANMDEVRLNRAIGDAAAMPRFRSMLIARHGKLVSQSYFGGADRNTLFDARSVTKSVVSMLTGIAIAKGQLSGMEATVGSFVAAPYTLDAGDRAVTVRQLLTMTSRYQWHENDGDDYNQWVLSNDHVQFLLDRNQNGPADFVYNSAQVNLLGVVLQKAVAKPLPAYAQEQLFQPLGINSAEWEQLETDMVNGGAGIRMTAEDLLRFGQLILQQGNSGTRQVVPASWVSDATAPKFNWRDAYGLQRNTTYGLLWWVSDGAIPAAFAWGFGGQFVYVAPSLDLVVVTTTNWQGISSETNATTFASQILSIIAGDILPAAR